MADDSSPDRSDDGEQNPFAGFPMFGDLARALQGQGPLNWDAARQFAMLGATEGQAEHNVEPAVRIAYTDLARIAGEVGYESEAALCRAFKSEYGVPPGTWRRTEGAGETA